MDARFDNLRDEVEGRTMLPVYCTILNTCESLEEVFMYTHSIFPQDCRISEFVERSVVIKDPLYRNENRHKIPVILASQSK